MAFIIVVVVLCAAVVMDFSRAYAQKNELQTAADAAALAGVIQLFQDPDSVGDVGRQYVGQNEVMFRSLPAGNSEYTCGIWDDVARMFSPSDACSTAENAVEFVVRDTASFILPALVGKTGVQVGATALAWMGYVAISPCVKPWAMAYERLTSTLDPTGDPSRELNDQDNERLRSWSRDQLRFELTLGTPTDPGNFGPLNLSGSQGGGTQEYISDIYQCNPKPIGPGDTLYTKPGATPEATEEGVEGKPGANGHPGLCAQMAGDECRNSDGTMGVMLVAVLWDYVGAENNGKYPVVVKELVSFSLDSLKMAKQPKRAIIIGHFRPLKVAGSISSVPTTIRRPVLVR